MGFVVDKIAEVQFSVIYFRVSPLSIIPGVRGGVVVKALRYKPAGRLFDS